MKADAWYIKFPGDPYALGPIRFETEVEESEVQEYAREWEGIDELPDEFECWPA